MFLLEISSLSSASSIYSKLLLEIERPRPRPAYPFGLKRFI